MTKPREGMTTTNFMRTIPYHTILSTHLSTNGRLPTARATSARWP